jgi:isopenicillin N synthase-like dioxygenase
MNTVNNAAIPIPVIDIAGALDGNVEARRRAAAALDSAARESGFFIITGHGVAESVISGVLSTARDFFALPLEEKQRCTTERSYRGYQGMSATALARTLGDRSPPDLSESFNAGRYEEMQDFGDDPAVVAMCYPNLWPAEPQGMRDACTEYFKCLDALSAELLRLLALAAGVPEDSYVSRNEYANSTMMLVNYYPAVDFTPPTGQLRRGAHSDYGTITLLYAEAEPGLQIHHDGQWRDIPAVEGGFIVNIGDLLSAWVDGRWTSTVHRVLVPEGRAGFDRVSVAFFVHPDYFTEIPVGDAGESVRAGEWIAEKSRSMMAAED